jgi:hypothetical protein
MMKAGCALLTLLWLSAACSSPTEPDLKGGVLATFGVGSESYSIFITNSGTIAQVIALQKGQSNARIPSGRVVKGAVDYNKPWSWHIDSRDITMVEVSMELCDGTPSMVEANLDEWIRTVGTFCPWSAELVSLKDYR